MPGIEREERSFECASARPAGAGRNEKPGRPFSQDDRLNQNQAKAVARDPVRRYNDKREAPARCRRYNDGRKATRTCV